MSLNKQICRTCLATETELLSVCAIISNNCRVIDYFNECLKISIINNDNLPQSICLSCLDNLLEVKKFHEKCISSENYFKQQQQTNINNDICNDESKNQINKEFLNTEVFDAQKNCDENDGVNEYFVEEIIEYEMLDNLDNTSNETQKMVEVETETESTTKIKHKAVTESFYCIECNECFKYEKNFNLHVKSEHDIKNNENVRQQDDDDSKTIEFTENESQNDMKKFRCELCGWFFKFRSNFIFHMRRHKQNNEFTIKCPYPDCKKEFFTSRSLRDHTTKAHVGDDESLLCPYCGLKLETKRELRRHLHRHNTGIRKYKCKFCGKLFSHKEHHKIHERIHTGERPFKCQYCKKTFKQSSTLNTHLTLHTGKPIKCQICSKRFSRNGFLRVHMRIHNDDKPYACEFCPLRYYQKCHLDSHLAVHSGERPFKCCVCGTRFAKKEILRSHYYIHAPKPYKCPECTLETASGVCLRKHLKNVHNFEDDIEKYKRKIVVKKPPEIDALIYSITLEQSNTEVSSIKEESQCE